MENQILPIHTEVALDAQLGREFIECAMPTIDKRILIVERSKFQGMIYSEYLKLYIVTVTDDITQVSKDYDLIILSGSLYCDEDTDHDCVLRYHPLMREDFTENYLYMPLTEEKLLGAVRRLLKGNRGKQDDQ
jgi:hypothetical protein